MTSRRSARDDLSRIDRALAVAERALEAFSSGDIGTRMKNGDDPVTLADLAVNDALRVTLPRAGEGWLSEETADDSDRLGCDRVWVVDPLDGTREFVERIPEWCVSVGLVSDGKPVAGGILNPKTRTRILGSLDDGVTVNGKPVRASRTKALEGALILASRSEVKRGEWDAFFQGPVSVRNMGSVAYKLGLVAAGQADATWTLVPKNEWDIAAGAALVEAAGGEVFGLDFGKVEFNRRDPLLAGLVATAPGITDQVKELLLDYV